MHHVSETILSKFYRATSSPVSRVPFTDVSKDVCKARVVLFGEHHHQQEILRGQLLVLDHMLKHHEEPVCLVMEMFSYSQQHLLDKYLSDSIDIQELESEYVKSPEGFAIKGHYEQLMQTAKRGGARIVAGFPPRDLCKRMVSEAAFVLQEIQRCTKIPESFYKAGSEEHYKHFQSLITGSNLHVSEKYRRIFPCQIVKDSYFARCVEMCSQTNPVLGICGSGHLEYGFGVPERIAKSVPLVTITSRSTTDSLNLNIADFIFHYEFKDS